MHSTMLPHTPPHTPPHTAAPPHTAPVPSTYFVSFAIRFVRKQASSIALRRVPPWPRKLRPLAFRDTYSHMATTIPLTVCAMAVVHKDALRTIFVLRDQFSFFQRSCTNVSTTPITAMGCRQCLPLHVVQLKGKHCQKTYCRNGVVDTFHLP